MADRLIVRGAKEHNLKNIDINIPRNALTVFTGLSGSGKSSLAFDTIFAEGQRRYVESLSSYARQFLGQMDKPDVEFIEGLSPAVSIDQKSTNRNPRSTVGTITEIYDYLRLLYARAGTPHCPTCDAIIDRQTPQQIVDQVLEMEPGLRFQVLAPVVRTRKGEFVDLFADLAAQGYARARVDGETYQLTDPPTLKKQVKHDIDVIVDRLTVKPTQKQRLTDSIETALRLADGVVVLDFVSLADDHPHRVRRFSEKLACPNGHALGIDELEPRSFSFNSPYGACPTCRGARLRPEILAVRMASENHGDLSIAGLAELSVAEAAEFLSGLVLGPREQLIAGAVLKEIQARLQFLIDVGLTYLTLNRAAGTLSGGEAQRIRLATQIGSGLAGVLYVLDEPSIGLHQRDNQRLIATLERLRDIGNTLIVVEHDEDTIKAADWLVDIGPQAGEYGGEVVYQGEPAGIGECEKSLTGAYLAGRRQLGVPNQRRPIDPDRKLTVVGARENNLKGIDVDIPLGVLVCVTGVSGSGKSTVVNQILARTLANKLNRARQVPGRAVRVDGVEHLDKLVQVDQSPIGRTPRSNPATYTGVFDKIRGLFAETTEAKVRGYKPGRFSFNVKGGRCEACQGDGTLKIEMNFLPDVYVPCEVCHGARYNRETLEVRYKGKNIAEVLEMPIAEAVEFFQPITAIHRYLHTLTEVGLGYVRLGQAATTLSGGEAQRVKLAAELQKRSNGRTIYILDEPTTGLHFEDIRKLMLVIQSLVDKGNSVIIIEHNLDVIKAADWIIDMGPEGGAGGGEIVAAGTPEEVAQVAGSYTGAFLAPLLA